MEQKEGYDPRKDWKDYLKPKKAMATVGVARPTQCKVKVQTTGSKCDMLKIIFAVQIKTL